MTLFFGSISFLSGAFFQLVGFYEGFNAIKEAADAAPFMIMEGFLVSCIAPSTGISFLLFSIIPWFIIKKKVEKQIL